MLITYDMSVIILVVQISVECNCLEDNLIYFILFYIIYLNWFERRFLDPIFPHKQVLKLITYFKYLYYHNSVSSLYII